MPRANRAQTWVDAFGQSLGDALDTGFYVCAIGGGFALVSGAFSSGWAGRSVERTEYADDGAVDGRYDRADRV